MERITVALTPSVPAVTWISPEFRASSVAVSPVLVIRARFGWDTVHTTGRSVRRTPSMLVTVAVRVITCPTARERELVAIITRPTTARVGEVAVAGMFPLSQAAFRSSAKLQNRRRLRTGKAGPRESDAIAHLFLVHAEPFRPVGVHSVRRGGTRGATAGSPASTTPSRTMGRSRRMAWTSKEAFFICHRSAPRIGSLPSCPDYLGRV